MKVTILSSKIALAREAVIAVMECGRDGGMWRQGQRGQGEEGGP